MLRAPASHRDKRGTTLNELMISTAVIALLMGSLFVGVTMLRRSFAAAQHHAKSQLEQARLVDYVARDLRRALTVAVDTFQGSERLNLTIPDYYDASGQPRDPSISGRTVNYGNPNDPVSIRYFKTGATVMREVEGEAQPIVTDVQDFKLDFTDSGKQTVQIAVTFVPRFRLSASQEAVRAGTATYTTTLLRNKRR